MKKNLLFGLLTILVAGFGFGGVSMANSVAKIGTKEYESLQDAIDNANDGDKITLLSDINSIESVTIESSTTKKCIYINKEGSLTIDLNGHSIIDSTAEGFRIVKGNVILLDDTGNSVVQAYTNTVKARENGRVTIKGGTYKAEECGNRTTIHATHKGEITIEGGKFYGGDNCGTDKPRKVIYAGGEANKCESPDSSDAYREGGKITVLSGEFEGRISHSNGGTYVIKGGTFDRNKVVKIDMDDGEGKCTSTNPYYRLAEGSFLDAGFLGTGYTMIKKDDNYVVMKLDDAAKDPDNKDSVQIAEGTTINTGGVTVEFNDVLDFLSGSTDGIKTGDNVSIPSSENGDILDAGNENLSIQGKLSLDFGETAKFSRPVGIRIAVNGNNGMRVKVKHNGGKFGFDGLAENADADCDNGKAATYIYIRVD